MARRALVSHIATYTLAFVPALVWLADDIGAWAIGVGGADRGARTCPGRRPAPGAYMRAGEAAPTRAPNPSVAAAADQSFHILALFLTALPGAAS